ncbi:glycoside hydrolase family 19 protein [Deinococcus sp. HMF7620]|uniref:Glycoside hydrolase family 19 protein n=1 Tax=Deinococcus arboris TaxID=2682977 RepID=A0A7C9M8B0_9DEIO|nr:glycoside hydrolase family 19 protein [Deinococcus arboris]MVN86803.1 glycoside hydrolase family 19 protein [Deinococcus arboris]
MTAEKAQRAADLFGITDRKSVAAWLANMAVEAGIQPKRENLFYTTPQRLRAVWPSRFDPRHGGRHDPNAYLRNPERLANLVYAGRLGNGDTASGDGWAFRGWGHLQITGRANTLAVERAVDLPLTAQPDLLEQMGVGLLGGAYYWARMSQANRLAAAGEIWGTRRAVNGPAMLHADEMVALYQKALPHL